MLLPGDLNEVRQNVLMLSFFGTRVLHILHNSFKHGSKASDSGVKKVLDAMFQIF